MKASQEPKPQPQRSIYRKLRVVLETARRGKNNSSEELIEALVGEGSKEFSRYKTIRGKVSLVPCSIKVVRRLVAVAHELGLLTESGRLTTNGRRAVDDTSAFDAVVGEAVIGKLASLGISTAGLQQRIRTGLVDSSAESLPTLDNIVSEFISEGVARIELRLYLGLLAACGMVRTTRKKLFLPSK